METKSIGVISSWLFDRGFGFVTPVENQGVKYYLHVSKIISGTPAINARVRFSVLDRREGRLPSAIEVEVESGVQ